MLAKLSASLLALTLVVGIASVDAAAQVASKAGSTTTAVHEAAGAGVISRVAAVRSGLWPPTGSHYSTSDEALEPIPWWSPLRR